jgi:hypothetical protein
MAAVSAGMAGPTLPTTGREAVAAPHARTVSSHAPDLGAHTAQVLAALGGEV